MDDDLPALAAALLDAARRAGAAAADAVLVASRSVSVGVRDGALEEAERAEGVDLGLRVLIGARQASVSSSDTAPATLEAMAERAVAMAREAPEDPTCGLADAALLSPTRDAAGLDLDDPAPDLDPAGLEALAREAEATARATPGIAQTDQASAGQSRRTAYLATSTGFAGGFARSGIGLSCVAITGTGTGMERDGYGDSRTHRADLTAAAEIGRIAAERTLARANPRRPKTGRYPVLFDEPVAASLIGHLVAAINGTAVARGASWLRDAMGEPVLPAALDLVEEPLRPRGPASRPFDGEGLACTPRKLVEAGRLQTWLLDLATARKLGLASTGNAARAPGGPPSPAAANLRLTQGAASPAELMADMGTGLLVTSLIGSTINPTTGEYSRGASGMWVENGAPAYPVSGCTIAGNLRDMLASVTPANDARPHLSRVVPSLLVESLTIAGD